MDLVDRLLRYQTDSSLVQGFVERLRSEKRVWGCLSHQQAFGSSHLRING